MHRVFAQALTWTSLAACGPSPLPPPRLVSGPPAAADLDPDPHRVVFELVASTTTVQQYGETPSEIWTYNGQLPGPTLQARVGDEVTIHFTNDLPEPTTIHWHGLRISDAMDGVPAIQQAVRPGETFTYRFSPPEPGTFWYHPHVRAHEQVERGLHGAFVVHPREEPEGVGERVFVVDDVQLNADGSLAEFTLDSEHVTQSHGRVGTQLLVNGQLDPPMAPASPSTSERWRVVNVSNASSMRVTVRGGLARVIARDGGLLETPLDLDVVDLPVGGRVDFEVRGVAGEALALEVEAGKHAVGKPSVVAAGVPWNVSTTSWATWPDAPAVQVSSPQQELALTFGRAGGGTDRTWTVNGNEWGEHTPIPLNADVPTRIRVVDESSAPHPFHLHGQFFRVVSRNGVLTDDKAAYDTVMLGPDEDVELFTTLDTPGRWMAHCHILAHAERGMMTELVVQPLERN